jgi:hypothetical protein
MTIRSFEFLSPVKCFKVSEEDNYIARFEAHKKEFEAIASNKFEHSQFRAMMKITKFAIAKLNSR